MINRNEITIPEYDELDEDLELKRKQLNQERKAFTESLIRLGKDREQLLVHIFFCLFKLNLFHILIH